MDRGLALTPRVLLLPLCGLLLHYTSGARADDLQGPNPKVVAFSGVVSLVVVAAVFLLWACLRHRFSGGDGSDTPDVNDPELARAEASLVETLDEVARQNYEQARAFQERYPPDSVPTEITLSQSLSIQEKGVSAWEFEPDMEQTNCFVECRTEIAFHHGECCVQTNLPLQKQQEVYYWEAKMYDKPATTTVAVGLTTKPYPLFRLPGWSRHSVAYFSEDGSKYYNSPFNGKPYGPQFQQGDVVGVGYRPRTGTVFFTRNGKKLDDAFTGLKMNLFPTVGANGPCNIHVNFGQAGFVFIEANVKKWGLAPMLGTLAPPPAYGSERGSILLESSNILHNAQRPSEDVPRISYTPATASSEGGGGGGHGGGHGINFSVPTDPALDISLTDITVPPPSYTSVDRYHERSSFATDEDRLLGEEGEGSGRARSERQSERRNV